MCITFQAPTPAVLVESFGAPVIDAPLWPEQIWQDYIAPIIKGDGESRESSIASYGMRPKRHLPEKIKSLTTMNARIETVGERQSYKKYWNAGQLCLVPMLRFYEPNYESGKHERWSISMADGSPFAAAGLWRTWEEEDGTLSQSFTQLTMNADDHPLMKRFHKPGEEKRSLIIVPQNDWDNWLMCREPEVARTYAHPYPAELMTASVAPAPAPKIKTKQTSSQGPLL